MGRAMTSPPVFCINPWIYDFAAYDYWSKPRGLLYLASFLRERGVTIDFLDCLDKWRPKLLGTSPPAYAEMESVSG